MKKLILILLLLTYGIGNAQINVLVHFTGNDTIIKKASDSLNFSYVKLERMRNVYSLIVKSKQDFVQIRKRIKKQPNVTIIGGWGKNGRSLSFPNQIDSLTIQKFKQRMKKYIRRNEDGDIVEDREYTNQELQNGVINRIFGWENREF